MVSGKWFPDFIVPLFREKAEFAAKWLVNSEPRSRFISGSAGGKTNTKIPQHHNTTLPYRSEAKIPMKSGIPQYHINTLTHYHITTLPHQQINKFEHF